ncbi:hypothetical protein TNCV_1171321 [Trichonephila clavipes]|nr:hypothetical protein TNCV_1171321 [Trichonephila clavipes]
MGGRDGDLGYLKALWKRHQATVVSGCITRFTPSRVRSLDVPPCTMSRTPTRFKQHRVTTTRPMNCYAVSTRLGRSRHRFFSLSHQDVDSRS